MDLLKSKRIGSIGRSWYGRMHKKQTLARQAIGMGIGAGIGVGVGIGMALLAWHWRSNRIRCEAVGRQGSYSSLHENIKA